jgi:hypothetical protein
MHKFALVAENGQIMQTGACALEADMHLQAQSRPELTLVECDAVYGLHYFKDGDVKEYPDRPSQHHEFDHDAEAWIDARTADDLAEEARQKRNALLAQSDWTQVPDAPVDKAAWATYRQALRDITKQSGFPLEVIWPNKPQ